MKRVIYNTDKVGNNNKYILKEEYNEFGLYQHKTPSGYFVSQEYAITNGNITVIIYSFNNICKEEVLDMIDRYTETGKFGINAMPDIDNTYIMHQNGKCRI